LSKESSKSSGARARGLFQLHNREGHLVAGGVVGYERVEYDKALSPVLHDVVLRHIAIYADSYHVVDACHTGLVGRSFVGFGLRNTFLCGGACSEQDRNGSEQELLHDASRKRDA